MDDRSLAVAARVDPDAFAELYRRHVGRVVTFAARRSHSGREVADVVATVFLRALEGIDRYDPKRGEPGTWLLGICANVHANWQRRNLREITAVERYTAQAQPQPDEMARYEGLIDVSRLNGRLLDALELLTPEQRAVFDLIAVEDLTPTQAARALGITAGAARVRLSRARSILRRSLGSDPMLATRAKSSPSLHPPTASTPGANPTR